MTNRPRFQVFFLSAILAFSLTVPGSAGSIVAGRPVPVQVPGLSVPIYGGWQSLSLPAYGQGATFDAAAALNGKLASETLDVLKRFHEVRGEARGPWAYRLETKGYTPESLVKKLESEPDQATADIQQAWQEAAEEVTQAAQRTLRDGGSPETVGALVALGVYMPQATKEAVVAVHSDAQARKISERVRRESASWGAELGSTGVVMPEHPIARPQRPLASGVAEGKPQPVAAPPSPAKSAGEATEAAHQAQNSFVAEVTHELRTPLTAIKLAVNLLQENALERLTPDEKRLLDTASRHVERMAQLVNEVLDLSKLQAGKWTLERALVEPRWLVQESAAGLASLAVTNELKFAVKSDEGLPQVSADPQRIVQVLTNLISNAIKFSPKGSEIAVRATVQPEQPGFVVFSVTDQGQGMSREEVAQLFQQFVQFRAGEKVGGTGLGLSIAKSLVELHGGRIWAESAPGSGTTFSFTLPVAGPQAR